VGGFSEITYPEELVVRCLARDPKTKNRKKRRTLKNKRNGRGSITTAQTGGLRSAIDAWRKEEKGWGIELNFF